MVTVWYDLFQTLHRYSRQREAAAGDEERHTSPGVCTVLVGARIGGYIGAPTDCNAANDEITLFLPARNDSPAGGRWPPPVELVAMMVFRFRFRFEILRENGHIPAEVQRHPGGTQARHVTGLEAPTRSCQVPSAE